MVYHNPMLISKEDIRTLPLVRDAKLNWYGIQALKKLDFIQIVLGLLRAPCIAIYSVNLLLDIIT